MGDAVMQCAFCGNPLKARFAWKGAHSRFYCGEFCAESEIVETVKAAETAPVGATGALLAHHLHRPYERLERLLPHMRQYSARTAPARRAA
jgi:hypothetical protein